MNKQTWTIAKMNLKNIKIPYFVTGLVILVTFVQSVIFTIIAAVGGNAGHQLSISSANYPWLLVLLAAIFIPARNFRKIVNLGGKRDDFFWGSMITYVVLAGAVSLANTILYYTYDHFLISTGTYVGVEAFVRDTSLMDSHYVIVNLIELSGWSANGIFFAVIQQFAFLLLLAAAVHTLTSIQDKWYGWAADVIIAAILAVFIPIASLRVWLIGFFNLIIFHSNAFLQISNCLMLAIVIYAFNKPILARKAI